MLHTMLQQQIVPALLVNQECVAMWWYAETVDPLCEYEDDDSYSS